MENVIYTPQKSFKILCGIVAAVFVFGYISSIGNSHLYNLTDNVIFLFAFILLIFFATYPAFGVRLSIKGHEIHFLKCFVYMRIFRTEDISDIAIKYVSNGYGLPLPCLYIFYSKNGKTKHIFLPLMHFGKNNLATVVSHIRKLNPAVNIESSVSGYLNWS